MFFGEHGIARMKETLAADVEYVPAIVRDLLDKVRLACEHREFLVAMDGVYRLDVDALHVERLQWLGDDDALSGDTQLAHFFETRTRQHEGAPAAARQFFDGRDVTVIAVVMRDKSDIELGGEFAGGDRRRLDFFVHAEIEIGANQEIARLDEPPCITHPPDGDAVVMRADFVENSVRRPGLRRRQSGSHHRNQQQARKVNISHNQQF